MGIKGALFSANYANAAVDEKHFIYHGDEKKQKQTRAVISALALYFFHFNGSHHLLIISTAAQKPEALRDV